MSEEEDVQVIADSSMANTEDMGIEDIQPPVTPSYPMEGVEIWRNPKNRFLIVQLHFRADEVKRHPDYESSRRAVVSSRTFEQEYNLKWMSFSGLPVYAMDWDVQIHSTVRRMEPVVGLPILRGWDFGLTPACVVGQLVGSQLRIYKEYLMLNSGAKQFSKYLIERMAIDFPEWNDQRRDFLDFVDPAGFKKNEGNKKRTIDYLRYHRIRPLPGGYYFEERRTSVEDRLQSRSKSGPGLLVSRQHCPMLIKGFGGGYQFPQRYEELEPEGVLKPLKNEYSHPHDALQMITTRLMVKKRRINPEGSNAPPAVKYRFG